MYKRQDLVRVHGVHFHLIIEQGFFQRGASKLVGPAGEVELTEGVIAAKRHIHATTADAERMGLENGQIVSVEIPVSYTHLDVYKRQ